MSLMNNAPRDRKIMAIARMICPGIGPIGKSFLAMVQFYPEHGIWAAEDRDLRGDPCLRPLHCLGWIC